MIHTIEYLYQITRKHSFTNDLKVFGYANRQTKMQEDQIYGLMIDENSKVEGYFLNLINIGIRFEYLIPATKKDNKKWIVRNPMNYLSVIVNVSKLLNKDTIVESDLELFKEKYNQIIRRIFLDDKFLKTESLNRTDVKFDYKCKSDEEKENLLIVNSKSRSQRYSANKTSYKTTLYYNGNNYQINVYDKFKESGDLKYYNILRYEVQLESGVFRDYFNNYGLIRIIDNYWNMRNHFMNEILKPLIGTGDYFHNNIIGRKINKARNKDVLFSKIKEVQSADSVDGIYTLNQMKQLEKLNINRVQNDFTAVHPLKQIFIAN